MVEVCRGSERKTERTGRVVYFITTTMVDDHGDTPVPSKTRFAWSPPPPPHLLLMLPGVATTTCVIALSLTLSKEHETPSFDVNARKLE